VWGFDYFLATVLAGGLEELSRGIGVPGSYLPGWESTKEETDAAFEVWRADLLRAAGAFRRYADCVELDAEEATTTDVKEALCWMGDHWAELWD